MWMIKKQQSYYESNVKNVIEEWDNNVGIKFIRVHFDKDRYMELQIYNSEIFTRQAPQFEGVIILDRFQLTYIKNTMESPAFDLVFKKKKCFKVINRGKIKIDKWINKEEFNQLLLDITEFVGDTDEYRTADILTGDYKNKMRFVS